MSSSLQPLDLSTEPDLHPICPTTAHVDHLLSPDFGLHPDQKAELVAHCLHRACTFGDLTLLSHLLTDRQTQAFVDLSFQDEEGVGLVGITIHGFGAESDRDVEREECVRLLIAQGAQLGPDKAGWSPLHHAVLVAPPSLVSHLMTHGCSPFDVSRRNVTPLDIVAGHSVMPGRDTVAFLLEESMRGEGWTGGRVAERRRVLEEKENRKTKRRRATDRIGKQLSLDPRLLAFESSDTESEGEEDETEPIIYTPKPDFSSMLVFSPPSLPEVFDSLITNFPPTLRDSQPANSLYLLARFACLTCDHTWLEDLVIGAADSIEDTFFNRADDAVCLVFWLYNTTIWLHLMRCDESISEACEMMGLFELIEEVINSIFVFLIRFAERKIDQLLDQTILDHSPLASEFDSLQFESEWSFLRPFTSGKKKTSPTSPSSISAGNRPSSPPPSTTGTPSSATKTGFSSLRKTFASARASSSTTPVNLLFTEPAPQPSPATLTSFLTALHSLLTLSNTNPALITQLWSQVLYWTSCEVFNRILTRKKYLCRSRAIQIGMNLSTIEEWIDQMELPKGLYVHFAPVHDLLNWLQCLSSMTEFSDLIATIQKMKHINPMQMRRALRDYRYEVQEGKMTEECTQYLTQLQKDWERHRVKVGVEALRKEMTDREREREESGESINDVQSSNSGNGSMSASSSFQESSIAQQGIDMLFDRTQDTTAWEPVQPPQVLGELLDSRYMLPLVFPSDPRLLAALPTLMLPKSEDGQRRSNGESRSVSRASCSTRGAMPWKSRTKRVREIGAGALKWVDGAASASRWGRPPVLDEIEPEDEDDDGKLLDAGDQSDVSLMESDEARDRVDDTVIKATPFTRKPSTRNKARPSYGGDVTPMEPPEQRS